MKKIPLTDDFGGMSSCNVSASLPSYEGPRPISKRFFDKKFKKSKPKK